MERTFHLPGHAAWTIAVVAALALLGLALYWWRVRASLARRDRIVLMALRLLAVAGVLGGYLQPSIRSEEVVRRRSIVPVLVDESASMGVRGPGGRTRSEQVAELFSGRSGWFDALEARYEVVYLAFSDRVRAVDRATLATPLDPAGGATDVLGALRQAASRFRPEDLGGFLVLSDGVDTGPLAAMTDPTGTLLPEGREAAAALPGPVVAVKPAAQEPPRDLALGRVDGLEYLLARNLARVRAEVRRAGVVPGPARVTLSEGAEVLAVAEVALPPGGEAVTAELSFLPRTPGPHAFQVTVEPVEGEADLANNARIQPSVVVRDALRVLHVAGHASWDERFLRQYLKHRRDVELVSFHTLRADQPLDEGDDQTTLVPFPAEEIFVTRLEGFDLVLLQDDEISHPDRARFAQALERYVRGGGAFLLVGGSRVLGSEGPWPAHLDPILPVVPPRAAGAGMLEGSFPVELSREGHQHPATGSPDLARWLATAPPLAALNPTGGTAPGATVLLRSAGDGHLAASGRLPVLVAAPRGEGRTAVLLTDTLWRWSFDPFSDEAYRGVLDGLLAWLTRDPSAATLRVAASPVRVLPGRTVEAEVRAAPGSGPVRLSLLRAGPAGRWDPAGDPVEVTVGPEGTARASLAPPGSGVFRLQATVAGAEASLEAWDLLVVGPLPAEVGEAEPALRPLSALATATRGLSAGPDLPPVDGLPFRPEVVARVGASASEPLWNHPLVFLLLVAVLGLEWYVERKIGYT